MVVTVVALSAFFVIPHAQALTLIPPSIEFTADPGQTISTEIKLYNETASSVTLYPTVTLFSADGETGNPTYDFTVEPTDLATWFEMSTDPVVLAAGERVTIPVAVAVPTDADPGGHYAALFYGSQPPAAQGGTISVGSKVGTLFLVNVSGTVVEQGSIVQFSLGAGDKFINRLPAEFTIRFANTGNVHVRPTGSVNITNLFGKLTTALGVNVGKGATLPTTTRKYEAVWERGTVAAAGSNMLSDFFVELGNEWRNFALGKYTAQVALAYGNATPQQDGATVTFWVVPWRVLIVSLIILTGLTFGLIFGIKKYNSWIIKKAQASK